MMIDFEKISDYYDVARNLISDSKKYRDTEVREILNSLNPALFKMDEETLGELVRRVIESITVSLDEDIILVSKSENPTWFTQSRAERGSDRFDAYSKFLEKEEGLSFGVVTSISDSMDRVVNAIGDPRSTDSFHKKGLVIGDVQSGKTGNFIALMNKAADAGYNMIIVTTGVIEKLRRQTQQRIEKGFGGSVSGGELKGKTVANFGNNKQSTFITNRDNDFTYRNATANRVLPGVPLIAVIKKNKKSLEDLNKWLEVNNKIDIEKYGSIDHSLLFIDDEADNATINTKKAEDPTTINRGIRDILNQFKRSSYVGFTATPFANILINHELEKDLFPRDFIQVLDTPTNYMGAHNIFPVDAKYNKILISNDDAEKNIPMVISRKEKNTFIVNELPDSLKEAVKVFFIQNAIRDLRGDKNKHRSMLVNVSYLNEIQKQVRNLIAEYVALIKREIKQYIFVNNHSFTKELKILFEERFDDITENFEMIKHILYKSVDPIRTEVINAQSNSFQYEDFPDGARVIAVGGFALSRGLTLEGLSVSYLYRNTLMYDTLMQMGRWFGYRPNYDDLVYLYMPKRTIDWYAQILDATNDLKSQIAQMANEHRTPEEFGLYIKDSEKNSDEVTLLITARNKMKDAMKHNVTVRISGDFTEITRLDLDDRCENNQLIEKWIERYQSNFDNKYMLNEFNKEDIESLLTDYHYGIFNKMNKYVVREVLNHFDKFVVKIMSNSSEKKSENFSIGSLDIVPRLRAAYVPSTLKKEVIALGNSRLGSTDDGKWGLTVEQRDGLNFKSQKEYFLKFDEKDRKPLLLLYPVKIKAGTGKKYKDDPKTKDFFEKNDNLMFWCLSLGVPKIEGMSPLSYNTQMNTVLQHLLLLGRRMDYLFNDENEEDLDDY